MRDVMIKLIYRSLINGTKWKLISTTNIKNPDFAAHIKYEKWQIKIQNAISDDRRGYKCIVYNKTDHSKCSSSVFFLRVQDKYAMWWPVIGIVIQMGFLIIVNAMCSNSWRIKAKLFGQKKKEIKDDVNDNFDKTSQDISVTKTSDLDSLDSSIPNSSITV